MARINYDTRHGQGILQKAIVGYVSHALQSFDCDPALIYEVVIVGKQLDEAFRTHGFLYITGHNISEDLQLEIFWAQFRIKKD